MQTKSVNISKLKKNKNKKKKPINFWKQFGIQNEEIKLCRYQINTWNEDGVTQLPFKALLCSG